MASFSQFFELNLSPSIPNFKEIENWGCGELQICPLQFEELRLR